MREEFFARLVAEEVKNKVTKGQADYLRLPENWTKWQRSLVALIENLEGQLESIEDQLSQSETKFKAMGEDGVRLLAEAESQYDSHIKKITRFKFHVEARLDEVTRMIALGSDAVDERLKTVEFLRRAIEQHRELVLGYEFEPTPIDKALWAANDGKWEFDSILAEDIV